MIIGSGQLAQIFQGLYLENTIIFASGVSNSNCMDIKEFKREEILLIETLKKNQDKKFVYFSSCALSAVDYKKNDYYVHKANMEAIVKRYSNSYYIFRIPQLFGDLMKHPTLINFLYNSIQNETEFQVYSDAYRYVIDINDLKLLVEIYVKQDNANIVIDVANPYKYKVTEIVSIFEELLDKKAKYEIINKKDDYILDLSSLKLFLEQYNLNLHFGEQYLYKKLQKKVLKLRKN